MIAVAAFASLDREAMRKVSDAGMRMLVGETRAFQCWRKSFGRQLSVKAYDKKTMKFVDSDNHYDGARLDLIVFAFVLALFQELLNEIKRSFL